MIIGCALEERDAGGWIEPINPATQELPGCGPKGIGELLSYTEVKAADIL